MSNWNCCGSAPMRFEQPLQLSRTGQSAVTTEQDRRCLILVSNPRMYETCLIYERCCCSIISLYFLVECFLIVVNGYFSLITYALLLSDKSLTLWDKWSTFFKFRYNPKMFSWGGGYYPSLWQLAVRLTNTHYVFSWQVSPEVPRTLYDSIISFHLSSRESSYGFLFRLSNIQILVLYSVLLWSSK